MLFGNSFREVFSQAPWFNILIVALIALTILVSVIKAVRQWTYNKAQPILTVKARVVAKRADVVNGIRKNSNQNDSFMYRYAQITRYYVTFEDESGHHREFRIKKQDYDMLNKDDFGKLTFQGTRYHGFVQERQKKIKNT